MGKGNPQAGLHRGMSLVPALLLAACALIPASAPLPAPLPTGTLPPAATFTLLPAAAASSDPTPLPTEALPPTATPTVTLTPSATRIPFVYVFPVQPQRDVGFSRSGHPYPATDIFAPLGAHFLAVTDGLVDFVSFKDLWDPATDNPADRGGLSVAIIGDDGVRYYGSHLSEIAPGIKPGVRVKAGQLLGLVGATGDAAGRDTHLHFGISPPTYPEDWHSRRGLVDPYPYLLAWKAGASVTPVLANLDPIPTPTP
jgi:murein DD-endopeptidase MepM/ murein hydrolase activator NlpD